MSESNFRGIGEKNYKIMKNYLKKKDDASFKKFVAVRTEIIKAVMSRTEFYFPAHEEQTKIYLALETMLTKKNFKNMVWFDLFISCRNTELLFRELLRG